MFTVPFSLFFLAFAMFWESSVSGGAPVLFRLWGLPFVAVGAYLVVGRFFHDAWMRGRTTYAVTDQRAIFLTGRTQKSIPLATLDAFELRQGPSGSGTLGFGPPSRTGRGNSYTQPAFEMIADARIVHDLVRDALQKAQKHEPLLSAP